jgi:hypothetical protein
MGPYLVVVVLGHQVDLWLLDEVMQLRHQVQRQGPACHQHTTNQDEYSETLRGA